MMKNLNYIKRHPIILLSGVFLSIILYAVYVYANEGGRVGRTSSTSAGCSGSGCHASSANTQTSVSVTSGSGSFTVAPNSTTTFTVTVTNSNKQAAGVNIAVKTDQTGSTDAGSLSPESGSGLQNSGGELTHSSPKTMSGGSASFSFTWTAPSSTGQYYLRVVGNAVNSNGNPDAGDLWNWMTPQAITVASAARVTLTTPNGSENWCPGSTHNITWTQSGVTNVKLELSSDAGGSYPVTLAASVSASAGSWSWNIPSNQTVGNTYRVRISDASNASLNSSSQGNFNVPGGISINSQPQNANVCSGTQVSFSVSASGTGLQYQWKKNGTNINNANLTTYSINPVNGADSGSYTCLVSGGCGAPLTSDPAILSVDISPKITAQPQSKDVCVSENVTISVTAEGTNLNYKWRKNGTDITGETNSSINLFNVKESDAGNYDCIVNGKCNFPQTSQAAVLKINIPPEITVQPQTVNACLGKKAFIFVTTKGSNLTYSWKKNGNPIANSNNDTLFFNAVSQSDEATYDVSVSGSCQPSAASSSALLVIAPKTQITTEPSDKTGTVGMDVDFKVVANGINLSYQWRKDGKTLNGKTTAALQLKAVTKADEGNYDCIVKGNCDNDTSKSAKLTVNSGSGGPLLSLVHSSMDFGNVVISSTRDTIFDGIIKNIGDQDLIISNVNVTGSDASEFTIVGFTTPVTILKTESKSLTIRFTPTKEGISNAAVQFTSNSATNPELNLSGFGANVKLGLPGSPINLSTTDKSKPDNKTFGIENQGNIDLNIDLEITGNNASDFSVLSEKTFTLPQKSTKTVNIQYQPGTLNSSDAELSVKIKESGETKRIALKGSFILAVTESNLINDFNIYPNPSSSGFEIKFHLTSDTEMDIRIINLSGDIIKSFGNNYFNEGTATLNWDGRDKSGNSIAAGSYRILYLKNGNIITFPIVVEN